jgi:toxin ParE1/3/4
LSRRPAVFAAAARADLREAVAWIARDNPAAARGLRDAAVRAAERIGANPFIGATRPRLGADRFRFLLLTGYSYVVVYTADTDPPRVLRVLHTARDLPRILAELDPWP